MSGRTIYFLAACGLMATKPAHADEAATVVLEPSSPWQLDYAETRCRIGRVFGEGETRSVFYMEQHEPSDDVAWVVAGDAFAAIRSARPFEAQFGPGIDPYTLEPDVVLTLGGYSASLRGNGIDAPDVKSTRNMRRAAAMGTNKFTAENPIGLPALDAVRGKGIDWVEISQGSDRIRLNTGNMGAVFEAMNACMADLVTHWGANPEALKARVTPPMPSNFVQVAKRIQTSYPLPAEREGESADLHIRMMVSAAGEVESCHTTDLTKAENFDDRACEIFSKYARFEPATGADGKAMASYYVTRISYRLIR